MRDGINAYDAVQVRVDFDNGMSINFHNNWITPADFEGPVNQGHEIVGADGKVLRQDAIVEGTRVGNQGIDVVLEQEPFGDHLGGRRPDLGLIGGTVGIARRQ